MKTGFLKRDGKLVSEKLMKIHMIHQYVFILGSSIYTCTFYPYNMLFNLSVLIQQDINHVYYETEFRIEWCRSNSMLVPCFLFARKFSQGAAMRLLSDGVVGNSDAAELLDSLP